MFTPVDVKASDNGILSISKKDGGRFYYMLVDGTTIGRHKVSDMPGIQKAINEHLLEMLKEN